MGGIRTNAAAGLIGVSPHTLRSWERRFGYPSPRRSQGGHRQYELADLESLRRALDETHNISSAIELARMRGEGLPAPQQLVEAFDRFDEQAADRAMERSLAVRSVERSLEELMLPGLELAASREPRAPEYGFGCRWATGWLHGARRIAAPATRREAVLIFDSSRSLDLEVVQAQALELGLRRTGFNVVVLSVELEQERLVRAMRGLSPQAVVLAGSGATLDVLGRLVHATRRAAPEATVLQYRQATPVRGGSTIPALGSSPREAVATLSGLVDEPPGERPYTGNAPRSIADRSRPAPRRAVHPQGA